MDRWKGKVAVVTGASSGIGLETAKVLVANGVKVVGLARREDVMKKEMAQFQGPGEFHAKACDVGDESQVQEVFRWIHQHLRDVNILVNCAGRARANTLSEIRTQDMLDIISVNLMGILHCTRAALKFMKKDAKNKESHIININSTAGHKAPNIQGVPLNVYPATKFAVTGLCQSLISELQSTQIKVSSISPGVVSSDFYYTANVDANYISMQPVIMPIDIANSILHVLSAPPRVQITELTIVPVGQVS